MRRRALLLVPALLAVTLAARASTPVTAPTEDGQARTLRAAGWLAGCWELRAGARVTHESWMPPAGGVMLGMSRTVVRDTTREWEHLMIADRDGELIYTAKPSRQAETRFTADVVSDTLLRFVNPAHDFPQRILYQRRGADSLVARIEGPRGDTMRGIDFPMRRIPCA
jgi:hypothetical protein